MKILKYIIYSLFILAMTSCEDFLVEKPLTNPSPSTFYTTSQGAEALITGCYSQTRFLLGGHNEILDLTVGGTDIFMYRGTGDQLNLCRYTPELNSTLSALANVWEKLYVPVNWANNAVKYIPLVEDMPTSIKNSRLGEALFLRAYYNFFIVQIWGGVHLTLEPTEGVETEANRTPVDQWYDAIIDDLEQAVELLPVNQSDWGRVNKYAAMHLLAEVLMADTRSSTAQYQQAVNLTETVISSGKYELLDNRASVFDYNNRQNKEIIWSSQFSLDDMFQDRGNRSHMWFIPQYTSAPGLVRELLYGRDSNNMGITPFYMTLFDHENDARYHQYFRHLFLCNSKTATLNVGDTALYFPPYNDSWSAARKSAVPYRVVNYNEISGGNLRLFSCLLKFHDPYRPNVTYNQGKKDNIIYRLAGTYLLAAEAHWRLNNNKAKVLEYINVIRTKAALPGKVAEMQILDWPSNDLHNLILDEMARELGGEYNRWFELKRFGKLVERVAANHPLGGANIKDFHVLRPIPLTTIDLLSNDYPQNPGYDY